MTITAMLAFLLVCAGVAAAGRDGSRTVFVAETSEAGGNVHGIGDLSPVATVFRYGGFPFSNCSATTLTVRLEVACAAWVAGRELYAVGSFPDHCHQRVPSLFGDDHGEAMMTSSLLGGQILRVDLTPLSDGGDRSLCAVYGPATSPLHDGDRMSFSPSHNGSFVVEHAARFENTPRITLHEAPRGVHVRSSSSPSSAHALNEMDVTLTATGATLLDLFTDLSLTATVPGVLDSGDVGSLDDFPEAAGARQRARRGATAGLSAGDDGAAYASEWGTLDLWQHDDGGGGGRPFGRTARAAFFGFLVKAFKAVVSFFVGVGKAAVGVVKSVVHTAVTIVKAAVTGNVDWERDFGLKSRSVDFSKSLNTSERGGTPPQLTPKSSSPGVEGGGSTAPKGPSRAPVADLPKIVGKVKCIGCAATLEVALHCDLRIQHYRLHHFSAVVRGSGALGVGVGNEGDKLKVHGSMSITQTVTTEFEIARMPFTIGPLPLLMTLLVKPIVLEGMLEVEVGWTADIAVGIAMRLNYGFMYQQGSFSRISNSQTTASKQLRALRGVESLEGSAVLTVNARLPLLANIDSIGGPTVTLSPGLVATLSFGDNACAADKKSGAVTARMGVAQGSGVEAPIPILSEGGGDVVTGTVSGELVRTGVEPAGALSLSRRASTEAVQTAQLAVAAASRRIHASIVFTFSVGIGAEVDIRIFSVNVFEKSWEFGDLFTLREPLLSGCLESLPPPIVGVLELPPLPPPLPIAPPRAPAPEYYRMKRSCIKQASPPCYKDSNNRYYPLFTTCLRGYYNIWFTLDFQLVREVWGPDVHGTRATSKYFVNEYVTSSTVFGGDTRGERGYVAEPRPHAHPMAHYWKLDTVDSEIQYDDHMGPDFTAPTACASHPPPRTWSGPRPQGRAAAVAGGEDALLITQRDVSSPSAVVVDVGEALGAEGGEDAERNMVEVGVEGSAGDEEGGLHSRERAATLLATYAWQPRVSSGRAGLLIGSLPPIGEPSAPSKSGGGGFVSWRVHDPRGPTGSRVAEARIVGQWMFKPPPVYIDEEHKAVAVDGVGGGGGGGRVDPMTETGFAESDGSRVVRRFQFAAMEAWGGTIFVRAGAPAECYAAHPRIRVVSVETLAVLSVNATLAYMTVSTDVSRATGDGGGGGGGSGGGVNKGSDRGAASAAWSPPTVGTQPGGGSGATDPTPTATDSGTETGGVMFGNACTEMGMVTLTTGSGDSGGRVPSVVVSSGSSGEEGGGEGSEAGEELGVMRVGCRGASLVGGGVVWGGTFALGGDVLHLDQQQVSTGVGGGAGGVVEDDIGPCLSAVLCRGVGCDNHDAASSVAMLPPSCVGAQLAPRAACKVKCVRGHCLSLTVPPGGKPVCARGYVLYSIDTCVCGGEVEAICDTPSFVSASVGVGQVLPVGLSGVGREMIGSVELLCTADIKAGAFVYVTDNVFALPGAAARARARRVGVVVDEEGAAVIEHASQSVGAHGGSGVASRSAVVGREYSEYERAVVTSDNGGLVQGIGDGVVRVDFEKGCKAGTIVKHPFTFRHYGTLLPVEAVFVLGGGGDIVSAVQVGGEWAGNATADRSADGGGGEVDGGSEGRGSFVESVGAVVDGTSAAPPVVKVLLSQAGLSGVVWEFAAFVSDAGGDYATHCAGGLVVGEDGRVMGTRQEMIAAVVRGWYGKAGGACVYRAANATATPSSTATSTGSSSATRAPTATGTGSWSGSPTASPSGSRSSTASVTGPRTSSMSVSETATRSSSATSDPTVSGTSTPTATRHPTVTTTPTPTGTPSATVSSTPESTVTRDITATSSPTASVTSVPTITSSPTRTPTDFVRFLATVLPIPTAAQASLAQYFVQPEADGDGGWSSIGVGVVLGALVGAFVALVGVLVYIRRDVSPAEVVSKEVGGVGVRPIRPRSHPDVRLDATPAFPNGLRGSRGWELDNFTALGDDSQMVET